jgi:hypothetical protein
MQAETDGTKLGARSDNFVSQDNYLSSGSSLDSPSLRS